MAKAIGCSNTIPPDILLDIEVCRIVYSSSWKKYRLFLSISMEGETRKTSISKTGTWNEKLKFVGNEDSTIRFAVHRQRRLGKDDILGISTVGLSSLAKDQLVIHHLNQSFGPPITLQLKVSVIALVDIPNAVAKVDLNGVGDTLERIVRRLDILVSISTSLSELNPVAKTAASLFRNAHSAVRAQISRDEKVAKLMEAMLEACTFLDDTKGAEDRIHESEGQRELVRKLMDDVIECFHFIHAYAGKTFVSRLVSNIKTNWQSEISKRSDSFQEFQNRWSIRAIARIQLSSHHYHIKSDLIWLGELAYCGSAHYVPAAPSITGSHPVTLAIAEWARRTDNNVPRIFLLYGHDHLQTTSIAQSVSMMWDASGCLASSFFFRDGDKYRDTHFLFPTIARDLADVNDRFRKALGESVGGSTRLRQSDSLSEQFTHLFLMPLTQSPLVDTTMIIIDACDPEIIHLLLDHANQLPSRIRMFLTAPPPAVTAPADTVHAMVQLLRQTPLNEDICKAVWKIEYSYYLGLFFFNT